MLQSYAVSLLCETPEGALEHRLYVIEANSVDAAEGRVMAESLEKRRMIRGLISRACDMAAVSAHADTA